MVVAVAVAIAAKLAVEVLPAPAVAILNNDGTAAFVDAGLVTTMGPNEIAGTNSVSSTRASFRRSSRSPSVPRRTSRAK